MATYQKSESVKEIMPNKESDFALEHDWDNLKKVISAWDWFKTSTHLSYKAGSTTAYIWNEGEKKKTKIYLPLQNGWYLTDKKYGIPNGEKSVSSNPNARYLWRFQDRDFNGLLVRRYYGLVGYRRDVVAGYGDGIRFGVRRIGKYEKQAKCDDDYNTGYAAGQKDLKEKIMKCLESE